MNTSSHTVLTTERGPRRVRRLVAAAIAALVTVALAPALAGSAQADQDVIVSPHPVGNSPRVLNGRVYSIDTYGSLVAVGGSFTKIRQGTGSAGDLDRQWLFIYNRETGAVVSNFSPALGGVEATPDIGGVKDQPGVEAVKFAPDGQSVYVGGWFTTVNGQTRNRLVRLNLDGSINTSFNASAANVVRDLALTGNRLLVAGKFAYINGAAQTARFASVDPSTGAVQSDFTLPASDSRNQYAPFVNELEVTPDGKWAAISGSFKTVGGLARNQLAIINLSGTPSVANWSTDLYAPNCSQASTDFGAYIYGMAFSPDSSFLIVNSTGAYVSADSMCDSATRFEMPPTATGDNQRFTWRAKTGGDTVWGAEVTDAAVYVGGHQRWMNNPRPSPGGDNDGPGSVARPGIAALDPLTGVPLSWNPTRDRGRGAEEITADDDYLYVGSDTNLFDGQVRQRLAQLPVVGGTANPQPTDVDLPVTLHYTVGSQLRKATFNGASFGSSSVENSTENWSGLRDGYVQNGKLFYFGSNSAFYSRPFSDSAIGSETNLSTTVGYVDTNYNLTPNDQPYGVAETQISAYHQGYIYYVKSGDTQLYKRGMSLESGIISGNEEIASGASFSGATALDWVGDWLYAAWNDGRLYRYYAPKGQVQASTRTMVDSGASGIPWASIGGMWSTQGSGTAVPPTAPAAVTCSGATPWKAEYWPNKTLTGAPVTTRCEAAVNYNYGNSAPSNAGVGSDNFSVTWTRAVSLAARGSISVNVTADDGTRAYVDGTKVIDSWIDSGPVTRTGTSAALEPGTHQVKVEYYESTGGASVQASYTTTDVPDTLAADTTLSSPVDGGQLTTSSATFAGSATDDLGVTDVRVGVQNRDNQTWLQSDGSWAAGYAYRSATVDTPGGTATGWSLPLTLPDGSFTVDARATDAAGNVDASPATRSFSINTSPVDTTAPEVSVSTPTQGQVVTGPAVTTTGTATDNVGVNQVRVAVYDRNATTNKWLQADGTFGSTYAYRTATLGSEGSASTTWSLGVSLPDGSYRIEALARDTSDRVTPSSTSRPFVVTSAAADVTRPSATITAPAKNSSVGNSVTAAGTASDNVGVDQVRVGVYDRNAATNKWLQADGSWGPSYAFRTATLGTPGGTSTTWSLDTTLVAGSYALDVKPFDTSSNTTTSSLWQPFSVTVGDAAAPRTSTAVSFARAASLRKVTVKGTARDNSAVRKVSVAVYKMQGDRKVWLHKNRSFKAGRTSRKARILAGPDRGRPATPWTLTLKLKPGRYFYEVTTVDGASNVGHTKVKAFRAR